MCHEATVELENVLWMLMALAGVVVLLTRMRLHATKRQAGHAQISDGPVNAHTIVGVGTLALVGCTTWSPGAVAFDPGHVWTGRA